MARSEMNLIPILRELIFSSKSASIIFIMNDIDFKIKASSIYLEELQQMQQELKQQNDEILSLLVESGHKNIREKLK
jgi:hypothetical protein